MADNVYITSSDGISAAGGLSAGKTSHFNTGYFDGRVGIGTTDPETNLEICSNLNQQHLYIQGANDSVVALARIKTIAGGSVLLLETGTTSDSRDILKAQNSSGTVFNLQADGKLGIGVETPTEKLTVAGNISARDNACIGGYACVAGHVYAECGRFSNDVCIGGNELFFPNDAESAYIKGADDLFIQADYDGDDTNKAIYLDTGGSRRANINQHGLSGSGGLSGHDGYFAGNVGIGISSPSSSLHICATDPRVRVDATTGNHPGYELLESGSRCWVMYNDPDNSDALTFKSDVDRFVIKDSGNVGIGCAAPTCKLEVGGNALVVGNTTITGNLSVTGDITCLDTAISLTSALSVVNAGTGPALYVEQDGSQPIAHFIDKNGDDIVFDDNGKVGIGTSSPGDKLTVQGNISANGNIKLINPTPWIRLQTSDASEKRLDLCVDSNAVGVIAANQSAQQLAFCTTNSERMRIDASGNVGIGYTSLVKELMVNGSVLTKNNAGFVQYDAAGNIATLVNQNGSDLLTLGDNNHTEKINIASVGNVGIDTTTPNEKLTVAGNISASGDVCIGDDLVVNGESITICGPSAQLKFCDTTDSDDMYMTFANAGTTYACVGYLATTDFDICTNNRDISLLPGTANVGIGETAPGQKLTVAGNICASGALSATSSDYNYFNGRVGAGVTAPATPLHVEGPVTISRTGLTSHKSTIDMDGNFRFAAHSGYSLTFHTDETDVGNTEIVRFHNSTGNVGIGTTTPGERLTVQGNISAHGGLSATNSTVRNYFAGCVGIGPKPEGLTPSQYLEVEGAIAANGQATDASAQGWSTIIDVVGTDTGRLVSVDFGTGYKPLRYQASCHTWQNITTEKMRLDSNGCLGIGTTSPGEKLTVQGTVSASGVKVPDNSCINIGTGNDIQLYHTGSDSYFLNNTGNLYIRQEVADGDLVLAHGTEKSFLSVKNGRAELRYDDSAKLCTTNTGINVAGGATINGDISGSSSICASNIYACKFYDYTSPGSYYIDPSATTRLNVLCLAGYACFSEIRANPLKVAGSLSASEGLSAGKTSYFTDKVGIGTAVPNAQLHISNSSSPTFRLSRTGTGQIWQQGIDSSGRFLLQEAASEGGTQYTRLGIDDAGDTCLVPVAGNVGIGTTNPEAKLTVQGAVSADGSLSAHYGLVVTKPGTTGKACLELKGKGNSTGDQVGIVQFKSYSQGVPLASIQGLRHNDDVLGCLAFSTSNSERVRIDNNGNVGIAVTDPDEALEVDGNIKIGGDKWYRMGGDGFQIGMDGGSCAMHFHAGSSEKMTLSANGYLGIGTTLPGEKLTVQGTVSASGVKVPDNSCINIGTGNDLRLQHTGSESQIFNNTGQLDIRTPTRLLVTSSGGDEMIRAEVDGSVCLYYDDSAKLCTCSSGSRTTGTHCATTCLRSATVCSTGCLRGSCVCGTSTVCSPTVCGTSAVCSPTVCGTTCGSFCTLYLTNLPTSSCCLCAGAVYNDGGYLKIVSGCGC